MVPTPSSRPTALHAARARTPQFSPPLSRELEALKLVAETAKKSTMSSGAAWVNSSARAL